MSQINAEAIRLLSEAYVRGVVSDDMVDRSVEDVLIYLMLNRIISVPDTRIPDGLLIERQILVDNEGLYEFRFTKNVSPERTMPPVFRVQLSGPALTVQDWFYGTERPSNNDTTLMCAHHYVFLYDVFRMYEMIFDVKLVAGKW